MGMTVISQVKATMLALRKPQSSSQLLHRTFSRPATKHQTGRFSSDVYDGAVSLRDLDQIKDRSHICELCKLILGTVEQDTDCLDALCSLTWEVDGREVFENQDYRAGSRKDQEPPQGLTRRIHLRWSDARLKKSYLVYVASGDWSTPSDAKRVWNPNLLFLGRKIGRRGHIHTSTCKELA